MKTVQKANSLLSEQHMDAGSEDADTDKAVESLQGKDKVGQAGELLGMASGAVAGTAIAGAAAGAAGATTLLGSSTLAGVLGGVFVTATPVGWVIGSTAVGAAAAYGIAKLVRSGATQDQIRGALLKKLKKQNGVSDCSQVLRDNLAASVAGALKAGHFDATQAARILVLVDRGALPAELALERVQALG